MLLEMKAVQEIFEVAAIFLKQILTGVGDHLNGSGRTAVVAVQIANVGSFQGFLVAVVLAGIIQIILGLCRLGLIAEFFPTCVIKSSRTAWVNSSSSSAGVVSFCKFISIGRAG